jgi:Pilus formation protein N terminal region
MMFCARALTNSFPASTPAALIAAATLMAAVTLDATASRANDLIVRYDQSQLLRLPRPVTEIIVGNPSIADVTVQGGNMLVVTGKTFGITNVIALDSERNVIQDQRVVVERDDKRIVNLNRGGMRQSYSCTPNCSPTLVIGDDPAFFNQVLQHASGKVKFSDSSGEAASQAAAQ